MKIRKSKYYKEVKKFMDWNFSHVDYRLMEKFKTRPDLYAQTFFGLIPDCVQREDYEGAQATKDAIIEFLNKFGMEIPDDAQLRLPEYKPMDAHGILCFGKEGDPTGIGSGGAQLF
jgi:hypothetical protein